MIQNKEDLHKCIRADFEAQGMEHPIAARFTYGENWTMFKYMKTLRKLEFYKNVSSHPIVKLLYFWYFYDYFHSCGFRLDKLLMYILIYNGHSF